MAVKLKELKRDKSQGPKHKGYVWLDESGYRKRVNDVCLQKRIPFNYKQSALGAPFAASRVKNWRQGPSHSAKESQLIKFLDWAEALPDPAPVLDKISATTAAVANKQRPKPKWADLHQVMPSAVNTRFGRIHKLVESKGVSLRRIYREHANPPMPLGTLYELMESEDVNRSVRRGSLARLMRWLRSYPSPVIHLDKHRVGTELARDYLFRLSTEIGLHRAAITQNWPDGPVNHGVAASWIYRRPNKPQAQINFVERSKFEFVAGVMKRLQQGFLGAAESSADVIDEPKVEIATHEAETASDWIDITHHPDKMRFARMLVHKDKEAQRSMFSAPGAPVTRLEALRWAANHETWVEFWKFNWVFNGLKELPDKGLVGNYNAGAGNDRMEPL